MIEKIGVDRSMEAAKDCDAALFVVDASRPLTDEDRRALADLIDQGRSILRAYGSSQFDDAYQPCSIDMQDDLTERLNRLVDGDPANVFDHCDRMLDQLDDVFERGKDGR